MTHTRTWRLLGWGRLLASSPELWHWLLYIILAILVFLASARSVRGV